MKVKKLYAEKIYSNLLNKGEKLLCVEEDYHHKTKYDSGRASYVERNQAMIENSDYCIFYFNEKYEPEMRKHSKYSAYYTPKSGTKLAYNYARQKKKIIINLF